MSAPPTRLDPQSSADPAPAIEPGIRVLASIGNQQALPALLAFSDLHESFRRRRSVGSPTDPNLQTERFLLHEVLQLICARAQTIARADTVLIALFEGTDLVCRASAGSLPVPHGIHLSRDSEFLLDAIESGEVLRCDDCDADPRLQLDFARQLQARSTILVPLRGRHETLGIIQAFSAAPWSFTDHEIRCLDLFSELVLSALRPADQDRRLDWLGDLAGQVLKRHRSVLNTTDLAAHSDQTEAHRSKSSAIGTPGLGTPSIEIPALEAAEAETQKLEIGTTETCEIETQKTETGVATAAPADFQKMEVAEIEAVRAASQTEALPTESSKVDPQPIEAWPIESAPVEVAAEAPQSELPPAEAPDAQHAEATSSVLSPPDAVPSAAPAPIAVAAPILETENLPAATSAAETSGAPASTAIASAENAAPEQTEINVLATLPEIVSEQPIVASEAAVANSESPAISELVPAPPISANSQLSEAATHPESSDSIDSHAASATFASFHQESSTSAHSFAHLGVDLQVASSASRPPADDEQLATLNSRLATEAPALDLASAPPFILAAQHHLPSRTWRIALTTAAVVIAVVSLFSAGVWIGIRVHTTDAHPSGSTVASSQSSVLYPVASPVGVSASLSANEFAALTPVPTDKLSSLPKITNFRHWSSPAGSTVVIDMDDQVNYEVHRLVSPERIYFDLPDTSLPHDLDGKSVEIGDTSLTRVRIGQPVAGTTRVVLDTRDGSNFSVSMETNPYRLVVELKDSAKSLAANHPTQAPAPSPVPSAGATTNNPKPVAAPFTATASLPLQAIPARTGKFRIVLDAGHGGWDLGTVGRQGLLEKDLVLDVTQRLAKLLETHIGAEVLLTRNTDDYLPLDDRSDFANRAQADLFVSVHANYSSSASARGVETYYTNLFSAPGQKQFEHSDPALAHTTPVTLSADGLHDKIEESRRLAASVQRSLYAALAAKSADIRDRGIKDESFVVLTGTTMPSILTEISFVSSPADEHNLQSETYRQQIAEAIFHGIARYEESSPRSKVAQLQTTSAQR